jgi:hypothetical protein
MAEFAQAFEFGEEETLYVLLAEEDGLTVTYPEDMELDDIQHQFDTPKYQAALKNGDYLSNMFAGAYSNGRVRPYNADTEAEYVAILEEFKKKHPNARSRFFGA